MSLSSIRPNHPACASTSLRLVGSLAAVALVATGCASGGPKVSPMAMANSGCADVNFPIYFAKGSDVLSDAARQAISAGAGEVKACRVSEVDVFGLADMDGPASQNLELSRRRAQIVAQALAGSGFPQPLFDVKGLGESNARTATGAPALLPRKALGELQSLLANGSANATEETDFVDFADD